MIDWYRYATTGLPKMSAADIAIVQWPRGVETDLNHATVHITYKLLYLRGVNNLILPTAPTFFDTIPAVRRMEFLI